MSFLAYDNVDGVFVNGEEGTDVADGESCNPVIHISKDADIPPRYYVHKIFSPMQDASLQNTQQRQSEKPSRFRMVHTSWGSRLVKDDRNKPVNLALVTVDNDKLNHDNSRCVGRTIRDALHHHTCEIISYDPTHILLQLQNQDGCQALGQAFLDEKLDDVDGFKVIDIEPSVLTNPPKAFFEVETTEPAALCKCLVNVIAPSWSPFTYLTVRHTEDTNTPIRPSSIDVLPALCLMLLFEGKTQANANLSLKRLAQSPWQPVQLPDVVTKSFDHNLDAFQNMEFSVPMFGVKTGCPYTGVQLMVLVQERGRFEEMEHFYHNVTGLKPLTRHSAGSEVQYCVFPLSQRAELVIAYYPEVTVGSLKNSSVYIQVSDVKHIQGIIKISADHWHINDPEGNKVVLFMPLK
ncbi:uncharacterized protein LOC135501378 [Lineus longissimus]|uniref:uncharacterized protein LOC135501378 n=1 Tax=Lineus longissimus TaxID=88925 RepID=UPI002B4F9485